MDGCQIVGQRGLTQVDELPGVLLRVDGEGAEGEVVQTTPLHNQQVSRRSHHLFLGGQSSQLCSLKVGGKLNAGGLVSLSKSLQFILFSCLKVKVGDLYQWSTKMNNG